MKKDILKLLLLTAAGVSLFALSATLGDPIVPFAAEPAKPNNTKASEVSAAAFKAVRDQADEMVFDSDKITICKDIFDTAKPLDLASRKAAIDSLAYISSTMTFDSNKRKAQEMILALA